MLASPDVTAEAKLFAATTLKGKVREINDHLLDEVLTTSLDHVRSRPASKTVSSGPARLHSEFTLLLSERP